MSEFSRMPRYDVKNDGAGPYAVFYCDTCGREFRGTPDVIGTVGQDIGRQAAGGLLRKIPLFGNAVADSVTGEDPRYSYKLTPAQLDTQWKKVQVHFRECPTCMRIVCLSDFDTQAGFCKEDSPRTNEIAEAEGAQAGAALKGFASALGLDGVAKQVSQGLDAASRASTQLAKCPNDGTLAAPGTKFCPECGAAMIQPAAIPCPKCGADTHGAKFCPECGTKVEQAPKPAVCSQCGAPTQGVKFCPNCGARQG